MIKEEGYKCYIVYPLVGVFLEKIKTMKTHYNVIIIGGGTGGIMTASQLKLKDKNLSIAIIEPSTKHHYQPAWTLVGAGVYDLKNTIREEASVIPSGVDWIQDACASINAAQNKVITTQSGAIEYDYLIVATGLQMDLKQLPGLTESLGTKSVGSIYTDPVHVWNMMQQFKGGNAVFTQADTPIKCGGAPQKIMYLMEHFMRKNGLRNHSNVVYASPGSVIFGVKEFAKELTQIIAKRNIVFKPLFSPIRIDSENNLINFRLKSNEVAEDDNAIHMKRVSDNEVHMKYDFLHIAPPQKAPDFIADAGLAHTEGANKGWMEVDIETLQNPRFANIFGVGDVVALPTAKTGAAIRKQAPVVVNHILSLIKNNAISELRYSGYSSCPLITGYGSMLLAEFKYNNVRDSDKFLSAIFDTTKSLYPMWLLKKYGLPFLYWNFMMKGKM